MVMVGIIWIGFPTAGLVETVLYGTCPLALPPAAPPFLGRGRLKVHLGPWNKSGQRSGRCH
jgi:hypothetical protein